MTSSEQEKEQQESDAFYRKSINGLVQQRLSKMPLGTRANDYMQHIGLGKMLRGKLVFRIGAAAEQPFQRQLHSAAAIELIHAASLLHDDVIDGGVLRRGLPSFWTEFGVQGAILLGDMLVFQAIAMVKSNKDWDLVNMLIEMSGQVCMAEVEQELALRDQPVSWEKCIDLARRKTGALFAFSAAAGVPCKSAQCMALKEAGYLVGTAYQLADDLLDASGDQQVSDKTWGSDRRKSKATAASVGKSAADVKAYIDKLCRTAHSLIAPWPAIETAWAEYMNTNMFPILSKHTKNS